MSSLLSILISKAAYFQLPNNFFAHLIESDTKYLLFFTCSPRTYKNNKTKRKILGWGEGHYGNLYPSIAQCTKMYHLCNPILFIIFGFNIGFRVARRNGEDIKNKCKHTHTHIYIYIYLKTQQAATMASVKEAT